MRYINHLDFLRVNEQRRDVIVLGKKNRKEETDIAGSCNSFFGLPQVSFPSAGTAWIERDAIMKIKRLEAKRIKDRVKGAEWDCSA